MKHVEVVKKPKISNNLLSYANSKYQTTFRDIKVVTWTSRLRYNAQRATVCLLLSYTEQGLKLST